MDRMTITDKQGRDLILVDENNEVHELDKKPKKEDDDDESKQ